MVENKHGNILEVARSLKFSSFVTSSLSGCVCVLTAVYLVNPTSIAKLKGQSLHEILSREKSHIDHVRFFGWLCYACHVPK